MTRLLHYGRVADLIETDNVATLAFSSVLVTRSVGARPEKLLNY